MYPGGFKSVELEMKALNLWRAFPAICIREKFGIARGDGIRLAYLTGAVSLHRRSCWIPFMKSKQRQGRRRIIHWGPTELDLDDFYDDLGVYEQLSITPGPQSGRPETSGQR